MSGLMGLLKGFITWHSRAASSGTLKPPPLWMKSAVMLERPLLDALNILWRAQKFKKEMRKTTLKVADGGTRKILLILTLQCLHHKCMLHDSS